MTVYRFMSEDEYRKLMGGAVLRNGSAHHGSRTTSEGFCFFQERPCDAIRWLSGIVNPSVCVMLEFPDGYLVESVGHYRQPGEGCVDRVEYCCKEYSRSVARVLHVDRSFSHLAGPTAFVNMLLNMMR